MRRRSHPEIGLACWLLAACAEHLPSAPRIDRVEPASAALGEAVSISIHGAFYLDARVSFSGGTSQVGSTFTASLAGVPLDDVRYLDARTIQATVPATLGSGAHTLVVTDPAGREGRREGAFTVTAPPARLVIEDAPGGAGAEVAGDSRLVGQTLALHAVARDPLGAFVADIDAVWSVSAGAGEIAPASGPQTVFTATVAGDAVVRAEHPMYGVDETGVIDVALCTVDGDCADPCHGAAACVDGACALGTADKDLDSDGAIDAACPGGTDCDDDPAGCGAACAPGLPDTCDGRDNDCDAATPDGADEAGFGAPCDGADGDLCAEGAMACDGAALTCDDASATSLEICGNGLDDDCDTATDAADPECATPTGTPPLVSFVVTPGAGPATTTFLGDAGATTDREGGPLTYDWDWDEDGVFDGSGLTSAHTYPSAAVWVVALRVTDATGLSAWGTFRIFATGGASTATVTTAADVNNGTSVPGPDFSLREAILWANATAGAQTIIVPDGMVIDLASALPSLSGSMGVAIVGDGAVVDGTGIPGMMANCFDIASSNNFIVGLEIRGCPHPVRFSSGTFSRVERCYVHDNDDGIMIAASSNRVGPDNVISANGGTGVYLYAASTVEDNRITGHTSNGIWVNGSGSSGAIVGNLLHDNYTGVYANGPTSLSLVHNTIVFQTHDGIAVESGTSGVDCRNNVFAHNTTRGVWAAGSFAVLDQNAVYLNGTDCTGCTHGPATLYADPRFVDGVARDLRLGPDSTLVDAGALLAIDRNGPAPGDYDGAGYDIGAWESPY